MKAIKHHLPSGALPTTQAPFLTLPSLPTLILAPSHLPSPISPSLSHLLP